jgi:hypothetical protein
MLNGFLNTTPYKFSLKWGKAGKIFAGKIVPRGNTGGPDSLLGF